jgi:GTP:adenosylcobinamide-phosphate guanylyltransferase
MLALRHSRGLLREMARRGKCVPRPPLSPPSPRHYAPHMTSEPSPQSRTYTAVVLAGSRPGRDAFAESFGIDVKALIPIAGEPMVRRPVQALLAAPAIGAIIVLSQSPERLSAVLPDDPRINVRESSGTIAATILSVMDDASVQWPVLVTTADHALLDAQMIGEFCSVADGSDLAIGVVERRTMMQRLPATKRTWIEFRRGAYTGANLFALASPRVAPAIALWRSVEQDRKKGWRLVALLGPAVLLGAALRVLTLDAVLARLGRKLGLKVSAVRLSNPLAGVDVDKPDDHALAEAIIAGQA